MTRLRWCILLLLGTAAAFGSKPSFEEHAAVQESLSRVHPRMRASWLRAHGLDDSYYTTFHRPESTGLKCIGRWPWGPSWELAGRDTFLYLGSGSGVRILSIADSVQPRMLGQINARGLVSQVVVQDSLLFVACGSWGAQIYSVSDPANPRELGSMDAVIGDLCVKDTFCYTVGSESFRIYNCADPNQPTQVGTVSDGGDVVVEADGYVYVGGSSGTGLNVYDVHDPASPTLVNALGGVQLAMFTRGHFLMCVSEQPAYFSIRDVSDPHSIHEVGRIDGYGGLDLFADDKYAYLSCSYEHDGLFVFDISDSSHPQLRDSINPEGVAEWDCYVPHSPGYGYLADHYGGLVVVDMHNVNNLGQAWEGYKADVSLDIAVDDGRAYIADLWVGMHVVDVADPTRPVSLGVYDTSDSRGTRAVAARDSFAFVGMCGPLRVLDVSDPSNPTLASEDSCLGWPQDFVLRDSLLYMVEDYRFEVFNVAQPRQPVRVGSCNLPGYSGKMDMQDSLAFVTNTVFSIVNVANPASPTVVGNYGARIQGVDAVDTIMYGTAPYTGLLALSVADPAHPYALDSLPLTDTIWWSDVAVTGSRAYVGGERVWVVDVSDPRNLRLIPGASWTPPYLIERMEYRTPYIYAVCLEAGVCVLETAGLGVEEHEMASTRRAALEPTAMRATGWKRLTHNGAVVFDAMGRRVTQAKPGVYFVMEAQAQAQAQASHKLQAIRKVLLVE